MIETENDYTICINDEALLGVARNLSVTVEGLVLFLPSCQRITRDCNEISFSPALDPDLEEVEFEFI